MERAEEARKDMQTLCGGWGSSGETQNRAGAGFHVDGFRHSGYGRRTKTIWHIGQVTGEESAW
jgi:hypothetical protein